MDLELEILILKAKYLELRYGKKEESHLQECCSRCKIECRYNENHDPETGRFTSGPGGSAAGHGDVLKPKDENELVNKMHVPEMKVADITEKATGWKDRNAEVIAQTKNGGTPVEQENIFIQALQNGGYTPNIRRQKQDEHTLGTKAWHRRIRDELKKGSTPHSFFYRDIDTQALFRENSDSAKIELASNGVFRQYISVDTPVGKVYNIGTRKYQHTYRFVIEYSKEGVHLYPVKDWNV